MYLCDFLCPLQNLFIIVALDKLSCRRNGIATLGAFVAELQHRRCNKSIFLDFKENESGGVVIYKTWVPNVYKLIKVVVPYYIIIIIT